MIAFALDEYRVECHTPSGAYDVFRGRFWLGWAKADGSPQSVGTLEPGARDRVESIVWSVRAGNGTSACEACETFECACEGCGRPCSEDCEPGCRWQQNAGGEQ